MIFFSLHMFVGAIESTNFVNMMGWICWVKLSTHLLPENFASLQWCFDTDFLGSFGSFAGHLEEAPVYASIRRSPKRCFGMSFNNRNATVDGSEIRLTTKDDDDPVIL